jgi:hypothetical protein
VLALTLALLLQTQTVAITPDPGKPAIVIERVEAEALFVKLCRDRSDDGLLRALAAGLNPMPDWVQLVMNGERTVCNREPRPTVPVPLTTFAALNQPGSLDGISMNSNATAGGRCDTFNQRQHPIPQPDER